jgi:hypothetical protein
MPKVYYVQSGNWKDHLAIEDMSPVTQRLIANITESNSVKLGGNITVEGSNFILVENSG